MIIIHIMYQVIEIIEEETHYIHGDLLVVVSMGVYRQEKEIMDMNV